MLIITGAAGLVGRTLRQQLRSQYPLICIDIVAGQAADNEIWLQFDINCQRSVQDFFRSQDLRQLKGLVHLAWYYDFSNQEHPQYQNCLEGLHILLAEFDQNAPASAVFIFASSMAALLPTVPGQQQTEESPVALRWQYPASKVRAEQILRSVAIRQRIYELVLAAVYSDHCELVPLFQTIERIRLKSPKRWFYPGSIDRGLTYIHVSDACNAIAACLTATNTLLPNPVRMLIGESRPMTNRELFHRLSARFSVAPTPLLRVPKWTAKVGSMVFCRINQEEFIRPWMIDFSEEHYAFDIRKSFRLMGWEPKYSIHEQLQSLLDVADTDLKTWVETNAARPWKKRSI